MLLHVICCPCVATCDLLSCVVTCDLLSCVATCDLLSLCYMCIRFVLYIEVACNGMFGAGRGGLINPPDPDTTFTISVAEVSVFEEDVYQLLMDITVLYDLTKVSMYVCVCVCSGLAA